MNYTESKQHLDKLRNKNEMLFRMAISHLMDVGMRHLTEENIEQTCAEIMKEDDSHAFMTNEFQCDLVRTAGELAKIDHIHLLNYISKNVHYSVGDNTFDYDGLMELLKSSLLCIERSHDESVYTLWDFEEIGLGEDEIRALGFGYLLNSKEDEEEEEE